MDKGQIKARFFGQHIGAVIAGGDDDPFAILLTSGLDGIKVETREGFDFLNWGSPAKLVLRPLSSITLPELAECFRQCGYNYPEGAAHYQLNKSQWEGERDPDIMGSIYKCANVSGLSVGIDYLRSLNFCLPFMGLDPVAEGWAVLEKTNQP